uniref:Tc1-like transposase DDE domain-containing protein n=1 Tax=Plectus sambesii TaxID=2011161 RepID=A0A914XCU0_9BILA
MACVVKYYLVDNNIATLAWPTRSPDLKIMENVWHLLELHIYQNQLYSSHQEMIAAIQDAVQKTRPEVIRDLFKSIPSQFLKVVKADGAKID